MRNRRRSVSYIGTPGDVRAPGRTLLAGGPRLAGDEMTPPLPDPERN